MAERKVRMWVVLDCDGAPMSVWKKRKDARWVSWPCNGERVVEVREVKPKKKGKVNRGK